MKFNLPQLIFVSLVFINMGVVIGKENSEPLEVILKIIDLLLLTVIVWWGGFFK